MRLLLNYLCSFCRYSLYAIGLSFIFLSFLALTSAPFWGLYWLGTSKAKYIPANKIVLLGGGGMPSESNLMRLWYAVDAAKRLPDADFVIAIPGDTCDSGSAICRMADYAEMRGVQSSRICFEPRGANTRSQALEVLKQINSATDSILLVTSPEHLRRAMMTFEKAGVQILGGIPAFPVALEGKLLYDKALCGEACEILPSVGENLQLRYQFWTHLGYEIILAREYCALAYYWLNDWI